jgi:hypothetical protein
MAIRLIIIWAVFAAISMWGSWYLAKRAPAASWVRVVVAGVLGVVLMASFVASGVSVEKSLASITLYFLYVATVFIGTAACAGMVIGTLIAWYVI